jgi:hypothetical protein
VGILVVLLLISLKIRVISLCLFVVFLFTVRRAGAIRIVMKRNRFDEREGPNLEVSLFLFHLFFFFARVDLAPNVYIQPVRINCRFKKPSKCLEPRKKAASPKPNQR